MGGGWVPFCYVGLPDMPRKIEREKGRERERYRAEIGSRR